MAHLHEHHHGECCSHEHHHEHHHDHEAHASHKHYHDHEGHEHHHHEHSLKKQLWLIIATVILLILAVLIERSPIFHFSLFTFHLSNFQLLLVYLVPYLLIGHETLHEAWEGITHGDAFNEHFLMSVATIGALLIGFLPGAETQYPEAVFVMLFFQVGELFEGYAEGKSRDSIAHLMDIRPDVAHVDGKDVSPDSVAVGSVIVVKPGEKVPLDGVVIEGTSALNTVALTGESLPRDVNVGVPRRPLARAPSLRSSPSWSMPASANPRARPLSPVSPASTPPSSSSPPSPSPLFRRFVHISHSSFLIPHSSNHSQLGYTGH